MTEPKTDSVTAQNIAQTFRKLLAQRRTNAYRVAKDAGVDKTYLSKLTRGAIAKPGRDKIEKIASALEIAPKQLLSILREPELACRELNLIQVEPNIANSYRRADWGSAPDGMVCYHREQEIEQIQHWLKSRSRLVAVYGMGGIGKTSLAVRSIEQLNFDYLIWRDTNYTSSVETIVGDTLKLLGKTSKDLTKSQQISYLVKCLRHHRCLMVLDRVEILLSKSSIPGDLENEPLFQQLLQQIAQTQHQSSLLLIGNDIPREVCIWQGTSSAVNCLQLSGSFAVCQQILRDKKLIESDAWSQLIEAYGGHPLAIKIVATTIEELFQGDVAEFLDQNTLFLGDLEFILHQQYERLHQYERGILHALARITRPLSIAEIAAADNDRLCRSQIMAHLHSLKRRSLLEICRLERVNVYTLQPLVRKYVNSRV